MVWYYDKTYLFKFSGSVESLVIAAFSFFYKKFKSKLAKTKQKIIKKTKQLNI